MPATSTPPAVPDVFSRLSEARQGDRIVVRLENGKSQTFTASGGPRPDTLFSLVTQVCF